MYEKKIVIRNSDDKSFLCCFDNQIITVVRIFMYVMFMYIFVCSHMLYITFISEIKSIQ